MVGPGNRCITPDLHDRLVHLYDPLPQTRLIDIEPSATSVSISRDWPSDRIEEVAAIEIQAYVTFAERRR